MSQSKLQDTYAVGSFPLCAKKDHRPIFKHSTEDEALRPETGYFFRRKIYNCRNLAPYKVIGAVEIGDLCA